jgi:methylated-DNA-protein-cysteine methyltransferase-like protein
VTNYERIYAVVERIPEGRVATYGQVAALAGLGRAARQVGYALHSLPDGSDLPWHRVINSRGSTSTGRLILHEPDLQRLLLESEGVVFNDKAVCDLSLFQWSPVQRKAKAEGAGKASKAVSKAPQTKTSKTGKKN